MLRSSRLASLLIASVLLIGSSGAAFAVKPDEMLPDVRLEARARSISAELRCLVCQNQSIDDSDADLARDLRLLVRDRLKAGDTDDAVKDYLVDRYGEYVLLKPRFNLGNALLWLAGPLALMGGAIAIYAARRSSRRPNDPVLSADEEARVEAILAREHGKP
jgi:cytochrome c-type biogenesis protein CcmH